MYRPSRNDYARFKHMGEPHALSRDAYWVHTVPHTQLYNVKSEKNNAQNCNIHTTLAARSKKMGLTRKQKLLTSISHKSIM